MKTGKRGEGYFSSLAIVALAAILVTGCGGDDEKPSPEEAACTDMAEAVGEIATRCGQDYQANYDSFIDAAAGGDCANIILVRDEVALRNVCFPSLQTITCADATAGNLDPSCREQLLR